MFHRTTPELQDQDRSVQDQDQDRFFWSQTGLVLRPTVSDHITGTESRASPKFGLVRRASTLFVMHFTFALIIISLLRQKAAQYNNIANTTIKGYLKNK